MKLLTQEECAGVLRKTVNTIYRLRMAGEIASMPGRPVLIAEDELNRYIERKTACHARTKAQGSKPTASASMKSTGQTMDDLSAARRARQIFGRHKKS